MAESLEAIERIGQLRPDKRNARKHNARNIGMIEKALGEVGAARSIVIDEDGTILAGNGLVEAAAQAGIERVQVVDADGETIVAVRRKGLTPEQKAKLALYDNRTAELAEWDAEVLADIGKEIDLRGLWTDAELGAELAGPIELPDILPEFTEQRGCTTKDENWFYVTFYGRPELFAELSLLLAPALQRGVHELDPDWFAKAVRKYATESAP